QGTAVWKANSMGKINGTNPANPLPAVIDQTFTKGMAFAQWLQATGGTTTQGQISIDTPRYNLDAVVPPSQRWIYSTKPPADYATLQHYTFDTPLGMQAASQCGRVLFSDFHVTDASNATSGGKTFPAECTSGPLTAQEKALE